MASLREQFRWSVLEEAMLLESIVRAGVEQGHWCLFRMGSTEEVRPEQCFSRESGALPLNLDLNAAGWSLVTPQGARQRGWLGSTTADPSTVERWVANAIAEEGAIYVSQVVQRVQEHRARGPGAAPVSPRVEGLLWVRRGPVQLQGTGLVDSEAPPLLFVEAMGAARVQGAAETWGESGLGLAHGKVGPWSMALQPASCSGHGLARPLFR